MNDEVREYYGTVNGRLYQRVSTSVALPKLYHQRSGDGKRGGCRKRGQRSVQITTWMILNSATAMLAAART
jgi:hypothetical protein